MQASMQASRGNQSLSNSFTKEEKIASIQVLEKKMSLFFRDIIFRTLIDTKH